MCARYGMYSVDQQWAHPYHVTVHIYYNTVVCARYGMYSVDQQWAHPYLPSHLYNR